MTLTRHAISSGRALFTLPGGRFYNATKPLEGRILDMTTTMTPMRQGTAGGYNADHLYVGEDAVACVYGIPMHTCVEDIDGPKWSEGMERAAFIVTAVNAFEANQARIAELTEALKSAAEVVNVAASMTGCRSDDEWVWSVQEQVNAALSPQP